MRGGVRGEGYVRGAGGLGFKVLDLYQVRDVYLRDFEGKRGHCLSGLGPTALPDECVVTIGLVQRFMFEAMVLHEVCFYVSEVALKGNQMSKGAYIGDYVRDYYRGYSGGY